MQYTMGTKFDSKVVVYGNGDIELIKYSAPYVCGSPSKSVSCSPSVPKTEGEKEIDKQENKKRSLYRSLKKVHGIVRSNHGQYGQYSKFITLTFADNVTDFEVANKEFNNFVDRLNYHVYGYKCRKLVYLGVREPQERGAIHYHVIFFNLPYLKKEVLDNLWREGSNNISAINNSLEGVGDVASYVTKYMSKSFYGEIEKKGSKKKSFYFDFEVWGNKKAYFTSRNIKRPSEHRLNFVEFDENILEAVAPYYEEHTTIEPVEISEGIFTRKIDKVFYKSVPFSVCSYISTMLKYCTDRFIKRDYNFKIHKSILMRQKRYFEPCDLAWDF